MSGGWNVGIPAIKLTPPKKPNKKKKICSKVISRYKRETSQKQQRINLRTKQKMKRQNQNHKVNLRIAKRVKFQERIKTQKNRNKTKGKIQSNHTTTPKKITPFPFLRSRDTGSPPLNIGKNHGSKPGNSQLSSRVFPVIFGFFSSGIPAGSETKNNGIPREFSSELPGFLSPVWFFPEIQGWCSGIPGRLSLSFFILILSEINYSNYR